MDTSKSGVYTYQFSRLSDSLYNAERQRGAGIVIEQRVKATPSASFTKPGQSFKYCMSEQKNEDKVPIVLTGKPPFSLEIRNVLSS